MDKKILLIDGHNLLFRSFYGIPARILSKEGKAIHGVVGFTGALLKVLNLFNPTHFLVVFDSEGGSIERQQETDYKANRISDWSVFPDEENPFSQLRDIYKVLNYLSWKYCEIQGVEADDTIANYVEKYSDQMKMLIMSTDSDLLQLVNDNVSLFYPRGKKSVLYTPEEVVNKYGVLPCQIPDFKALVGDKTDNITGVSGIGAKTAQKLLNQFKDVVNLCANTHNLPLKLRLKIESNRDDILKNLSLIKLDKRTKLPFNLNNIKIKEGLWNNIKTMGVLRHIGLID